MFLHKGKNSVYALHYYCITPKQKSAQKTVRQKPTPQPRNPFGVPRNFREITKSAFIPFCPPKNNNLRFTDADRNFMSLGVKCLYCNSQKTEVKNGR